MVSFLVRPAGSGGKALLAGIFVTAANKNREVALTVGLVVGYILAAALLLAPVHLQEAQNPEGEAWRYPECLWAYRDDARVRGLDAVRSFRKNIWTVIIDGAGILMQLGYVCRFLYFAVKDARRFPLYFLLGAIALSAFLAVLVIGMVIIKGVWTIKFMGIIASIITGLSSLFTLVDIVVVVKSRRASNSKFTLVELVLGIFNAATWTYCAFVSTPFDLNSGVPCAICLGCLCAQMVVYLIFRTDDEDYGSELLSMFHSPV